MKHPVFFKIKSLQLNFFLLTVLTVFHIPNAALVFAPRDRRSRVGSNNSGGISKDCLRFLPFFVESLAELFVVELAAESSAIFSLGSVASVGSAVSAISASFPFFSPEDFSGVGDSSVDID